MSKPIQTVEELDAVLHWRGKHAQAIRERDALQALLTAADERADMLEELLRRWLSRHAMGAGTDSMVIAETIAAVGVPALKPAGKAAGKLPNIGAIWERNGRTITISPEPEHVGPAAPWVLTLPTALKPAEGGGDD